MRLNGIHVPPGYRTAKLALAAEVMYYSSEQEANYASNHNE